MKMFHGTRLYAVDSRAVGTFGGRAKRATLKIYDGTCANSPRITITGQDVRRQMLLDLRAQAGDHLAINTYLRGWLPYSDPYHLPKEEN